MRVITGSARGRKLKTPANYDIRPTTDNVKESMFNILNFDIEGRRVLDLFAGTGQLGIEALSRGAKEAVFVDVSKESISIVKDNLKLCGFYSTVIQSDAIEFLKNTKPFDIILIDPPYDSQMYDSVIDSIVKFDLLNHGGIIIAESRPDCVLPDVSDPYRKNKEYRYGKVKLTSYVKEGTNT